MKFFINFISILKTYTRRANGTDSLKYLYAVSGYIFMNPPYPAMHIAIDS